MKNRTVLLSVVIILLLASSLAPVAASPADGQALVLIAVDTAGDLDGVEASGVPVYARMRTEEGRGLLAGAAAAQIEELQAQGLAVSVLDTEMQGASYYLAYPMPGQARIAWEDYGSLLLDGGREVLLRTTPEDAIRLAERGVELQAISLEPKPLRPRTEAGYFPTAITPDPLIQGMIDQVTSTDVYSYTGDLSGEWSVIIGSLPYTITTRNTYSGTPIQKATQYAGEHLADLGLDVEYHEWSGSTYPNVIGELPGLSNPDDVFIISGHIDDMPSSGLAPGADDNASGSVATLLAADIMTQYEWGCTLRFALWTGEEQGLLGSQAYAQRAYNAGENIVGVLNLDMIAYNTIGSSPTIDLHADDSIPATLDLAQLFADVVGAYSLNLIPEIVPNGSGASDHASFWNFGYTSILGIEDFADFNPYYHTPDDLLENVDMDYYVDFVKASVGTFAHMSGCLIPEDLGSLDGTVTEAGSSTPIEDADLAIVDAQGNTFPATTDPSGYYTRTLLSGTYTVTASAYGYEPEVVSHVPVTTDTVTTVDFVLDLATTYTVSGTVTEEGSGMPLEAEVDFQGAGITVWTDPATGLYEANLPAGNYTMRVSAAGHRAEERPITVDQDQTQDFALGLLSCILLVDDDAGDPYESYYEGALAALGQDYDVWTVAASGGPSAADLAPYGLVIWFTGDEYDATLTTDDQAALSAYLDGGGRFFVSGQDIGYDIRTTDFYQNYLHATYLDDDTNSYDLTGLDYLTGVDVSILGGDGANNQDYPSNVSPRSGASATWSYDSPSYLNGGVTYQDATYGVSYFSFGFEAINNQADRTEVMSRTLSWLGACACEPVDNVGFTWTPRAPVVDETVIFTGTAEGELPIEYAWDFGDGDTAWGEVVSHSYSLDAEYTAVMTASNACGEDEVSYTVIIRPAGCEPVSVMTVTADVSICTAYFAADLAGNEPFSYTWDFGGFGVSTAPAPTVDFGLAGTYPYTLTAWNCGGVYSDTLASSVNVTCEPVHIYLPLVLREG